MGGILLAAIAARVAAAPPAERPLDAAGILQKMAKAYAECRTYRDSGVVKTVFIMKTGRKTVEKPFSTAFVRPDRFRFEFCDTSDDGSTERCLIARSGDQVQSWWTLQPKVSVGKSLGMALAGATGISGGSAHTIPNLLLPEEVTGFSLPEMDKIKRIADARIGTANCFRIQGEFRQTPMTLWIDQRTFLLRRLEERNVFEDFRTEEITDYSPTLNEAIPDKLLAFDPPTR